MLLVLAGALTADEDEFYRLESIPLPEGFIFEVSGLDTLADGRPIAAIRKGEVWVVDGAYGDDLSKVRYTKFAEALHEPLGLLRSGESFYLAQRGEVTRLRDTNGDGVADEYWNVASDFGLTGNYHGYAYGPKRDRHGNLWITLNIPIGKKPLADERWRGWGAVVTPEGKFEPMCAGMRSPSGLGGNLEGDVFYTDQQGNWIPTCTLSHLRRGAFYGHADSLRSCKLEGSPIPHPGKLPAGKTVVEAARLIDAYQLPAVWFPYRKAGMSATDVVCDTTRGAFGPFAGQLFVGDFTTSSILRVFLEKVDGEYQGACFRFREGFQSAVFRMTFGKDGTLFVGETNRGWNSLGTKSYGFERLRFRRKMPFEVKEMRARPDGFELELTKTVDGETASNRDSYKLSSYTYKYHATYGSPEIDRKQHQLLSVDIDDSGKVVRIVTEGLRAGYVHELELPGLRDRYGEPLLHDSAYYTLNRIPDA